MRGLKMHIKSHLRANGGKSMVEEECGLEGLGGAAMIHPSVSWPLALGLHRWNRPKISASRWVRVELGDVIGTPFRPHCLTMAAGHAGNTCGYFDSVHLLLVTCSLP